MKRGRALPTPHPEPRCRARAGNRIRDCWVFAGVIDARATDRMYDCLPLYRAAGGLVATGRF
jgi:hypothetical protein